MTQFVLILAIVLYFLVLVFIGIFSRKESDSVGGYYAAGKKLRYWIVSFSTNATGESSWLLLGLSGMGYVFGVHALWVMVGEVLGVAFAWIFRGNHHNRAGELIHTTTPKGGSRFRIRF